MCGFYGVLKNESLRGKRAEVFMGIVEGRCLLFSGWCLCYSVKVFMFLIFIFYLGGEEKEGALICSAGAFRRVEKWGTGNPSYQIRVPNFAGGGKGN